MLTYEYFFYVHIYFNKLFIRFSKLNKFDYMKRAKNPTAVIVDYLVKSYISKSSAESEKSCLDQLNHK